MKALNNVIIIGSGVGGMCAAAALAPHSNSIKIYCKDHRPTTAQTRKSVPQGDHISILLQGGLYNLDSLFPGIHQQLIQNGSSVIQAGIDQQIFEMGRWTPSRSLDLYFLGQSRPFLEHQIYLRAREIANIAIENNTKITEFLLSENNAVVGIRGTSKERGPFTESADLVVDASGVNGKLIEQIQKVLGTNIVEKEIIDINIFYSTAHFHKPEEFIQNKENILIIPEAGVTDIGGSLIDIENDSWCVSLHGRNNAEPPKDLAEWLLMVKQLAHPKIWERVKDAEPFGEIKTFKKPHSHWRHFEKSEFVPEGYIPIGDTISSVNPIFGQGMTVAIGHAIALRDAYSNASASNPQLEYLKNSAYWSKKAWQKTATYDKNFSRLGTLPESSAKILSDLAKARHQKITEDSDAHLNYIRESQML